MALPVAAHSSLLPADPVPEEPVVARPPADPLDAEPESGSGGSPIPATAVPLDPVRRVAPTKAAITAERITRCVFLVEPGRRPSDTVPRAPQSTDAWRILEWFRFTSRRAPAAKGLGRSERALREVPAAPDRADSALGGDVGRFPLDRRREAMPATNASGPGRCGEAGARPLRKMISIGAETFGDRPWHEGALRHETARRIVTYFACGPIRVQALADGLGSWEMIAASERYGRLFHVASPMRGMNRVEKAPAVVYEPPQRTVRTPRHLG